MLQEIYKGAAPNDKTGTPARPAAQIINDNFAYLNNKIDRKDGIIVTTGHVKVDELITYNAFWQWIIDGIEYTNPVDVPFTIPLATSGYQRVDLFALTTSNTFLRIAGTESNTGVVDTPDLPADMIQAGLVLVTDTSVGDPSVPDLSDYATINYVDSHSNRTDNPHNVTKSQIGLGNVDNTSDINKPVSTAQASADAATLATAQAYAANLITQIINGAPSDGDTLKELNDKIIALQAIVGGTSPDGDSIVNTVTELLAVFASFPEGVNLVTLLAGKVNTTDVYNALDCIVANKVLDARQGKVLNDLITALTTVVGNKVDKVAGERLINAGEITKLGNQSGTNTGDETTATLKTKIDVEWPLACSDETSSLTTGQVISFRAFHAFTLSSIRANLTEATTISTLIVDIKEAGVSIFSTMLSIDATELTSVTAAVPAVISDPNIADDALITIHITQIGSGNAGKGLKITMIGKKV